MPCVIVDSARVSADVLVRNGISATAIAKTAIPTPAHTDHSHGAAPGATNSPTTPVAPTNDSPTSQPVWLRCRAAIGPRIRLIGTPSTLITAAIAPASPRDTPALISTCGAQPIIS